MSERAEASGSAFWGDADDAEALRRCRALVNALDDGIYQLDPEGRFVAVNDVVVETTGYERERLLGEHVSLLLDPEDVRAFEREIDRRLDGASGSDGPVERDEPADQNGPAEPGETFEFAVGTADGDRVPCEMRFNLLVEDGSFQGTVGVVRDVSDRERTERALDEHRERERELERYETLLTESQDVNAVLNPDGTFEFLPPSTENVLGYDPDELLGEDAFQYVHPDDRERVWELFADLVENPESEPTTEFRYRHADGSWIVLETHARNLLDDPTIGGVVAYTRDVTERKRREQELQRYEAIVEAVNDGVYVVDGDGRFVMVNEAYAELTGYDREELLGEHVSLVVDEDVRRRTEQTEATLRDGDGEDDADGEGDVDGNGDGDTDRPVVEAELETKSGERVPAEATFALLPGSKEERRVGVVRDLSERKERQRALQERERQLSTLMDNVPGMVYRARNERGWPIEFVSDACREVTGNDPDAFERGEVSWGEDVMVEDDRADVWEEVQAAVEDGETFSVTYRIETADGDRRWVRSHGRGVENEDGEVVVEGIVSDVTERKRLEAELDEVFGRVTDAFYALDDQWQFTHANERAEELIDYRDEGLVGRNFWEVFEWATDSKLGEEYRTAMETQEPTSFEFYYPEPLEAWYEVHAYPSETGLSVYFRDVTERKRFEDALAALHDSSRELFRAESAEAVTRQVVEAGTEVLELSDVALYLYDGERGDLYPAAKATEEGFMWDDLPRIPPDDSTIAGHAFASGETVHWDDIRESPNVITTDTDMRSGVYVPVGDHGVVFAGSATAGAFGERTRQLVELLAANAEVALDRVERERKLEESERRYRTLTEHFPNGAVALVDEDLRYRTVGGSPTDVADVRAEEVEGSPVREVLPPALADELVPRYEAALDGESSAFEFEADYNDRVFRFHVVPVRDDDGDVFAALGMSQDVTERTEYERKLEESERRYRTLAEHFPNGLVTLFDHDLRYTLAAGQGFDRIPVDPDDLEGNSFREVWDEETADALEPAFEAALDGEERSVELEYEGREWVVHGVPITDERGDVFAGMTMAQDITEQKERERDLREAKSQLEAAAEAGAVGTWEWHIQEDQFVSGASFARTFGVDPDAAREGVSLDRFVSAIHEDDRERVERKIEEAVETCGEYEAEYRVWDADGELRWVVARGHVECDDDGNPVTFPGALADITERKRAEAELEEHRKQLETLFEVLPVGVVVADADGRFVEANETAKELWGGDVFDAEDVAEYDRYRGWWADTGEPVDPDEWTMARVLRGEEVTEPDVFEIETTDGERRVVMAHGMPVREDDGEVTRGVVTITDVTERTEYERKLEESERRYRTLAEHFPNGAVGVYDGDLRYTLAQGGMLGEALPEREQLEGRRMSEIFPSHTVADLEPLFRAAVEDGETGSTTTEFGGRNWRVWATPLRDADGEIFAGLSFAQDITEQVERERKLEETVAKLEESNERLESFASMLAHELRNPVTIGQIYGQRLPDEAAPEAVQYVTEAFDRIEDMIDVMLVLTRGREAVGDRSPLSIPRVVEEAWDSVDAPDATLEVDLDAEMAADETYVRHLFRNLFENAVQHGGEDATVTVGDLEDGFYVADDGVGIPADRRDDVFETGFTTAGDEGGTGLGLAFVAKLAEVYDWTWSVHESESGGARFEFRNVDLDAPE